jgi:cation transport regulator ChaC
MRPPDVTFVFGYGSLLRRPGGIPCHLLGHRRAWNVAMDNRQTIPGYKYYVDPGTGERPPLHVAFLNIYPAPEGRLNGVACPVALEMLQQLDRRERNYVRVDVTQLLDVDIGGTAWAYLGRDDARQRFEAARRANTAVVSQDYFDAVRDDFATVGGLDEFDQSTDRLTVPLRGLTRVDLPPPPPAQR